MAVNRPYHEQVDIRNTTKLRELESTLPPFMFYFFRGIEPNTSSRTRIAYAYDLRVFFDYLLEKGGVVGTPGSGFGPAGEYYFRLTAFGSRENTIKAMERFSNL